MPARDEQPPKKKTSLVKKTLSPAKAKAKKEDDKPGKTSKPLKPTNKTNNKLNKQDDLVNRQIEDAIMQAFTRFQAADTVKQAKLKDLYQLDTVVTEYLQSFMILGYDINGEKVFITHAENMSARDALVEHLRTTFLSIMNNGNAE